MQWTRCVPRWSVGVFCRLPCLEELPERASNVPLTAIPLDAKGYSQDNCGADRNAQEPARKTGPAHGHNQDGTGCNPEQWYATHGAMITRLRLGLFRTESSGSQPAESKKCPRQEHDHCPYECPLPRRLRPCSRRHPRDNHRADKNEKNDSQRVEGVPTHINSTGFRLLQLACCGQPPVRSCRLADAGAPAGGLRTLQNQEASRIRGRLACTARSAAEFASTTEGRSIKLEISSTSR